MCTLKIEGGDGFRMLVKPKRKRLNFSEIACSNCIRLLSIHDIMIYEQVVGKIRFFLMFRKQQCKHLGGSGVGLE